MQRSDDGRLARLAALVSSMCELDAAAQVRLAARGPRCHAGGLPIGEFDDTGRGRVVGHGIASKRKAPRIRARRCRCYSITGETMVSQMTSTPSSRAASMRSASELRLMSSARVSVVLGEGRLGLPLPLRRTRPRMRRPGFWALVELVVSGYLNIAKSSFHS